MADITPADITPTLADVGATLRARTRSDETGGETGTFTADTRPTGDEVTAHIASAAEVVALRLGVRVPTNALPAARLAVTYRAAYMIELSLQPDQTDGTDSVYARLKALYDELMADLQDVLLDAGDATTRRMTAVPVVSPTLAPLPDDWRIPLQFPYGG